MAYKLGSRLARFLWAVCGHPAYKNSAIGLSGIELLAYETGLHSGDIERLLKVERAERSRLTVHELSLLIARFPEHRDALISMGADAMTLQSIKIRMSLLEPEQRTGLLELALANNVGLESAVSVHKFNGKHKNSNPDRYGHLR